MGAFDEATSSLKGEQQRMCVSCGCGQMNDDHGDKRNITMNDLRSAAQAANTDVPTVARNIQQSMTQGGKQQGMGGQPGMGQGYGGQPGMGQSRGSQSGQPIDF
jgi:hypothetical protein